MTGFVFVLSFFLSGFPVALYWWFVWSIFTVIFIYDLKHKIIPNGLVYSIILISLISLLFSFHLELNFSNFIAGPLFFLVFASFWLFSGGTWMGLGDAKLFLAVGWMLGLLKGASAVILSFWLGAIFSLSVILLYRLFDNNNKRFTLISKPLTMKSEVPFGPFIIIGVFIVYLFGFDILSLDIFLNP